jgi:hypothetical protein
MMLPRFFEEREGEVGVQRKKGTDLLRQHPEASLECEVEVSSKGDI